ncbi:MAG: sigma-70 family RNA polymerase sigma factor [Chitinophagales bacterium]|nr:sigma-70 family RNA polymerase sigma factor [Chitinophagales bacterium]
MDWIKKIKDNPNSSLEEIYTTQRGGCIAYLQNQFQLSEEDAIEIFQLSVIVLYDNITNDKLQTLNVQLKSYLFGIAKNKCYELFKKKKKEITTYDNDLLNLYLADEIDSDDSAEQLQLLVKSLDDLGQPCNELLQLFYYQNKKIDEIADTFHYKNTDTAKNMKYKCLKRLQSIYFGHYNKKNTH